MSYNRKIRNATKCELDGIRFDSRLEMTCYSTFKQFGIQFELKPKIELLPKIIYGGKTIRAMTFTPDFWLFEHKMFVDAKGYPNDAFPLKLKLLQHHCKNKGYEPEFVIVKSKKEINSLVAKLLG